MAPATTTYQIAVVPGDGIGPEVCEAAVQVLKAAGAAELGMRFADHPAGAELFRRTGDAFPPDTLGACRNADAILHGAAGLPDVLYPDGTEAGQDFSMKIRSALDLYANLRPIRLYPGVRSPLVNRKPGDIDYVIVRENSEGLYASRGHGIVMHDSVATDTLMLTRLGTERIVRAAAELCIRRRGAPADGKHRVTVCDKSNVLRSFAFFRKVACEVLEQYPQIEVDFALTDAITIHMVERPERFDVVVAENFVGDMISDLGAATVGGMGMSESAETGDTHGYFQASHGTAPSIAGKNIANPVATILSAASLAQWLGQKRGDLRLEEMSRRIRAAVEEVLLDPGARTSDLGGPASTSKCTEAISALLADRTSTLANAAQCVSLSA